MEVKKFREIKNDLLDNMGNEFSKIEGSHNYDIATTTAIELDDFYEKASLFSKQLFPWSVTQDKYLDYHMAEYGLERRTANYATGQIKITGKIGTVVPVGTVALNIGGIKYITTQQRTIQIDGTCTIDIVCLESGTVGNCGVGDICLFEIAVSGVYKVENEEAIANGYEIESFESAKERMEEKAKLPAHSGNIYDYKLWAKSITGVGKVSVFPLWNGNGTVKVLVSDYDLQIANEALVLEVTEYIEEKRPIGADVTVASFEPYLVNVEVEVIVQKKSIESTEELRSEFETRLKLAFTDENFTRNNILSVAKVGNVLLNIDGVVDYDNLVINGHTSNIKLNLENVCVVNNVEITGVEYV